MALINTEIKPFKATAFQNGDFFDVTDADLRGKWSVFFFYPADFTFVCPTELEDLADQYEELQELGVEVYSRLDRHALQPQGLARHLGHDRQDPVPDARRPDRHAHAQLRRAARGAGPGRPRHLRDRPRRRDPAVEITSEGVGRNAAELVRKIKAAQYVRAHPGEVCPAKWEEGDETLAPSLDLVGKI